MGATKPEVVMPPLEHAAFSIAEFCSRNHISRPMYHRMRTARAWSQGDAHWAELDSHHFGG